MPVYKNVTIGNFGAPVVISEIVPKAQLMQTGKKRSVSQGLSTVSFPNNHPPKPIKNWRAFSYSFSKGWR